MSSSGQQKQMGEESYDEKILCKDIYMRSVTLSILKRTGLDHARGREGGGLVSIIANIDSFQ